MKQTFTKDERLHRKILIGRLFQEGAHFYVYPFRVKWMIIPPEKSPAQLLISVPRQYVKKAVNRNYIKRRIRESYRLNKPILYTELEKKNMQLVFSVCYTTKEILTYQKISEKIIVILHRLSEIYAESTG
ncbi:MAG: ribonuclease P protein component [Syntrophothermus sp.]